MNIRICYCDISARIIKIFEWYYWPCLLLCQAWLQCKVERGTVDCLASTLSRIRTTTGMLYKYHYDYYKLKSWRATINIYQKFTCIISKTNSAARIWITKCKQYNENCYTKIHPFTFTDCTRGSKGKQSKLTQTLSSITFVW